MTAPNTFERNGVRRVMTRSTIARVFARLDYDAAQKLLPGQDEGLEASRKFIEGDHWQDGDGYIGPRPWEEGDEEDIEFTLELVEAIFTSRNATLEVCERHADAVAGIEGEYSFGVRRPLAEDEAPSDAEQAMIDEVEAAMTEWMDERGASDELWELMLTLLWAGRAAMRIEVPTNIVPSDDASAEEDAEPAEPSFDDDEEEAEGGIEQPRAATLAEALSRIYIQRLDPEDATVHVDPDTRREVGIVRSTIEGGAEEIEIVALDETRQLAIWQTLASGAKQGEAGAAPVAINLGGRLPMIEVRRRPLITEQVRSHQRGLNLAETMVPRSSETVGFRERIFLAAMPPGEWERDPTTGERLRLIPEKYRTGAGTTQFVQPVDVTDKEGKTTFTEPSVVIKDPTAPDHATAAAQHHYEAILGEANQTHVLIAGDAVASAVSRQHARAGFISSVRKTGTRTNRVGRWLVETVLAYAEYLMGAPGRYTSVLRATYSVVYDFGQPTPEERAQNNADVIAGTLDRVSAMIRNGVVDPDATLAAIEAQPDAQLEIKKKQAEVAAMWINDAGANPEGAYEYIGLEEEDITLLAPDLEDPDEVETPPADGDAEADRPIEEEETVEGGAGDGGTT